MLLGFERTMLIAAVGLVGCGGMESDFVCTDDGVCEEIVAETSDEVCASVVAPDVLPGCKDTTITYASSENAYAVNSSTDEDWTYISNTSGLTSQSKFTVKVRSIPITCEVRTSASLIASSSADPYTTCSVSWQNYSGSKYFLVVKMKAGYSAPGGTDWNQTLSRTYQFMPTDDEFANTLSAPFALHLDGAYKSKMSGSLQTTTDVDTFSFRPDGDITRQTKNHRITLSGLAASRVKLFSSDGVLLGSAESANGIATLDVALNVGPTYFVLVQGLNSKGAFSVDIDAGIVR
jgi:hypothetical protein